MNTQPTGRTASTIAAITSIRVGRWWSSARISTEVVRLGWQSVLDYAELRDIKCGRLDTAYEIGSDIGRLHLAGWSELTGEPLRERAVARADLDTPPVRLYRHLCELYLARGV